MTSVAVITRGAMVRWRNQNMYPSAKQVDYVREQMKGAFGFGRAMPPTEVVFPEKLEEDPERLALFKDCQTRAWWNIKYETLTRHRDSICLFNETGFCHYIPAFVLAALEFSRADAYELCCCVLMNLNPVDDEGVVTEMLFARFEKFSAPQKLALAHFIHLFLDVEGLPGRQARLAFDAYWGKVLVS